MIFSRPATPPAAWLFTPAQPAVQVVFDAPCPGCGRLAGWREWPAPSEQQSERTGIAVDCPCEDRR